MSLGPAYASVSGPARRAGGLWLGVLLASAASALSVHFVDDRLSLWVAQVLTDFTVYDRATNVPDQLMELVLVIASLSWAAYFHWRHTADHARWARLGLLLGSTLPTAFALKVALKWFFGRTETHTWLAGQVPDAFHWWAGGGAGLSGFPSGHMLVLSPLLLAFWHCFPRYRWAVGVAWAGLGAALVITEYHFLGDVLAGGALGAGLYASMSSVLSPPDTGKSVPPN